MNNNKFVNKANINIIFILSIFFSLFIFTYLTLSCEYIYANNLNVTNVSIGDRDPVANNIVVKFDVSFENSWKTKINHDAIWFTVRLYDPNSSPANKKLCKMTANGLNPAGTYIGSGFEIFVPSDKNGAFIRPSAYGKNQTVTLTDVKLNIDYSTCGFNDEDNVQASVFGIEMVYVPEGSFYAGDNGISSASLAQGISDTDPWYIVSANAINVGSPDADGFRYVSAGNVSEDATGTSFVINSNFPNGFSSFYAMKYEITEGQWVEFVNSLSSNEARVKRDITNNSHKNSDAVISRNTISCSGSPIICSTSRQPRPVSFINWMDLAAFLDWSSLRPMSELEYEKMTRGPIIARSGEFAWGNTTIIAATTISSEDETGLETITNTGAVANYNDTLLSGGDTANGAEYSKGGLRSGIFASSSSTRESSGAGYYGAMELSGNLKERVITVGNLVGRSFVGSNGDGVLSSDTGCEGNALQSDWPGVSSETCGVSGAEGSGFRGGSWSDQLSGARLRISDRYEAAKNDTSAYNDAGGRGVRTYEE